MEPVNTKAATGASPVAFLAFLPGLVSIAKEYGYALAVHGSMARDYDLIAIAWTHSTKPPEELVQAFVAATGGYVVNDPQADPYDFTKRSPEPKPHGRLAWTIHITDKLYIDLSVIPPEGDSVVKLMDRLDAIIAKA
jgi:hypothetical protein